MSLDRECIIVRFGILVALPKGDFHQEAEDILNRWFEVLCEERVQYYENCAKKAKVASNGANRPSDVAVPVNIKAELNLS
jgi:hypothetical protein